MPCGGRSAPFGFVMGQRQESLAADAASTEAVVPDVADCVVFGTALRCTLVCVTVLN